MTVRKKGNRTIGFVMFPERGGYYPTFKLAKALKSDGYQVIYFGTSEFKNDVIAQGFDFHLVFQDQFGEGVFDASPLPKGTGAIKRFKRSMSIRRHRATILFESLISGSLVSVFKSRGVDLLLIDSLLSPIAVISHLAKTPVISITTELVGTAGSVAPHHSSTLICSKGSRFNSARIALNWSVMMCRLKILTVIFTFFDFLLRLPKWDRRLSILQKKYAAIQKKSGLPFTKSEHGPRPILPELALCPAEFEFELALQRSTRKYIGHCIDLHRSEVEFPWEKLNENKPIIYCSLGTQVAHYASADNFFTEVLKTATSHQQYVFVISMGPERDIADFGNVPPNVIAQTRIPQLAVLEKAAMMITNGGLGTVKECIYFAVPMLVLPCAYDQPGNAARVCFHKIGRRGNIKKITANELTLHIHHLINDSIYKNSISVMSKAIRQDIGFLEGLKIVKERLEEIESGSEPTG